MTVPPHVPDLGSLAVLLAVARAGSLSGAGVALGVTQQAVSSRVRSMERQVGVPLLVRSPSGSRLTEQGQAVAGWASRVMDAVDELAVGVAALRGDRDSHLAVAASLTVAEHLLPGWLVALHSRAPGTQVVLTATNSWLVARLVETRSVDVGFVESADPLPGLSQRRVGGDELVLVVPPNHPWARRRVGAAQLARTPLVVREQGSGTRQWFEQALGLPCSPPLVELVGSVAVRAAVMAGASPAVLSVRAVADDLAAGRLVRVALADAGLRDRLRRTFRAVWATGVEPPAGPVRDLVAVASRRPRPT